MPFGCVSIILFLSFMLSSVGFDSSLNVLLCPFLGVLSKVACICFMSFVYFDLFVFVLCPLLLFWLFSLHSYFFYPFVY
jgi:hypothetical protein